MGNIKNLINRVALNCSTIPEGISPLDYSALVVVELLPNLKGLEKDEEAKEFGLLLEILKSVCRRSEWRKYSKMALLSFVKEQYLIDHSLENLKGIIQDSKFCKFPNSIDEPMWFKSKSSNPPKLREDYGDQGNAPEKGDSPKKEHKRPQKKQSDTKNFDSETIRKITESAEELPNVTYVWEAKINYETYCEIQELVKGIFNQYSESIIISEARERSVFRKIVKFYIAEWYKREFQGGANREKISIPTELSKIIAKDEGAEEKDVRIIENNGWQSYIWALGGLPVYYLLSDQNNLTRKLSGLFDQEDGREYDATEELFNNKIINRSESIKQLIPLLQKGEFPYDEEDQINSFSDIKFKSFNDNLEKGFQFQNQRRKFSLEYRLWLMPGFSPKFSTCIRFKPNVAGEGRNFAINEDRLKKWGIKTEGLNQFVLEFDCISNGKQHEPRPLPFFKCLKNDWVPLRYESIVETDFPLFENIRVRIGSTYLPEIEVPSRNNNGYIQFYSNDRRSWTSRGSCGRYSLIVFDPSKWSALNSKSIEGYEYVELHNGKCELNRRDNEQTVPFYNAEGNLFVEPKKLLLQENFFENRNESKFPCKTPQGTEEDVYVTNSYDFNVGILKKEGDISWIKKEEYSIEIYDSQNEEFNEIREPESLRGFQKLRFRFYNKSAEIACFFVSQNTSITRSLNGENGTIKLNGLQDLQLSVCDKKVDKGTISCRHRFTKESSCCKLAIEDKSGYQLQIDIILPYKCTDVLYASGPVQLFEGRNSVPAILTHQYVHRIFSENGLKSISVKDEYRYELNKFIHNAFNKSIVTSSSTTIGGAQISLFSNSLNYIIGIGYVVKQGKVGEIYNENKDLKFVFVPIDEGDTVELSMKTIDKDRKQYLIIDIPDHLDKTAGIIIQSIKGLNPKSYYRAEYKPSLQNNKGKTSPNKDKKEKKRGENITKYLEKFNNDIPDFSIALRAFDIAIDFECYFGWFDELKALGEYDSDFNKRLTVFLKKYIETHEHPNYKELWRLAGEFMFDWMLIPAYYWRNSTENEDEMDRIERLFLARPGLCKDARYYTRKISKIIRTHDDITFRRNNNNIENKIAQCIRGEKSDCSQFKKTTQEEKKEIFKSMIDPEKLKNVCNLLMN